MTQPEVEEILALGHEIRSFEVKRPGSLNDKAYVAKIARAAMAMGNLRDGGLIGLGVDDNKMADMLPGLDAAQLAEWTDFDRVSDQLARFSEPPVSFELQHFSLTSGADFVILKVAEFDSDIHVCKRDHPGVLQAGQTYVRPRGKPRSAQVPSSTGMRELHDLAIDKGVREFVRRAGAAGVPLSTSPAPEDLDEARFEQEAVIAWAEPSSVDTFTPGALIDGITVPAYTDVAIRPSPYLETRLRHDQLVGFITEHSVRLRGWPVPMIDSRRDLRRHGAWVGQDLQAEVVPHVEAWRMFTSGQFLHRRIVATDLRDSVELRPEATGATGAIAVWDVLLYMVEVAELGARIATDLSVDTVTFDVSLDRIAGRELVSGDWRRELYGPFMTSADRFAGSLGVDVANLLATPRDVGVDLTQQLLRQFGVDIPDKVLADWQAQVIDRR